MLTGARLAILLVMVLTCLERSSYADEFRVAELYGGYSLLHGNVQKSASG